MPRKSGEASRLTKTLKNSMITQKKLFIVLFLIILVFSLGCKTQTQKEKAEQEKCDLVCTSMEESDFATVDICRQECKKKAAQIS